MNIRATLWHAQFSQVLYSRCLVSRRTIIFCNFCLNYYLGIEFTRNDKIWSLIETGYFFRTFCLSKTYSSTV